MGTRSFPGVKSGRGLTLTPHPLLVPWSWKSRAIPLLPLWAVRPVQSLSTCTRVTFTFYLITWLLNLRRILRVMFQASYMTSDAWNINILADSRKNGKSFLPTPIRYRGAVGRWDASSRSGRFNLTTKPFYTLNMWMCDLQGRSGRFGNFELPLYLICCSPNE